MAKEYAIDFYNGKAWRRCRDGFMLSKYYICERCGGVAVIAHHKEYITPENIGNPNVTLSWGSLEALCLDCHNVEHMAGKATADGVYFDADGNCRAN